MKDTKEILEKLQKFRKKDKNLFLNTVFAVFIALFLFFNIVFSQKISPIFFGLANNDRKSAVEFLQKIRSTREFYRRLKDYENVYGPSIKDEVFAKERAHNLAITKLEQILEKNHQARDVLYSLYELYLEKGDNNTAENYLKLAREVDPTIK